MFKVVFSKGTIELISLVYAVDAARNKFLISDYRGSFMWVDINNCTVYEG